IKRFKILSSRYRNKRRRFALRVSLICGIYNFQM
ncbi:MAG: IS5/IS1182 family transposase, partial [Acutalibacteraceae bacterium]|nr:IS5/IS1182 family transposase [Acutalibacteraceae bacterium]MEE1283009.1 IS5/IS1182 family transposase [Acutalibacteraceae bacterium]